MVLINSDGNEVEAGDTVISFRGEEFTVAESIGRPPHKPSSTGRIHTKFGNSRMEYFPSVFNCKWVEE